MGQEIFDLLIIGGGIMGAGVARDAALRGLKVALVEKDDFGGGTTSCSTRLIHGGLRYLELFDFGLVREALRERELLLRLAPHRVRPLPFLVPLYAGQRWKPLTLKMGMTLYDLLSWGKSLPSHRALSANEVLQMEPGLRREGLIGGMLYYDAQVPVPERLVLDNLLDACRHGACVANYARVVDLLRERGRVVGVVIEDDVRCVTQQVRARCVVNTAGPWVDEVVRLGDSNARRRVRCTKGVHLVAPRLTERAVLLLTEDDGRVFFVVPWNDCALIGTTDTDFEDTPDRVAPDADDVRYLVRETQRAFPQADLSHIHYTFAGVRALVRQDGVSESSASRRHQIVDHAEDGLSGLLSVVGGKITTYRRIAEDVVNDVCERLGRRCRCSTHDRPFLRDWNGLRRSLDDFVAQHQLFLSHEQVGSLMENYGEQSLNVLQRALNAPHLCNRIASPYPVIWAELERGVEEEMVCSSADFLLRRTSIGFTPEQGRDCVETVSDFLGQKLGWSAAQVWQDVDAYHCTLERMGVPVMTAEAP